MHVFQAVFRVCDGYQGYHVYRTCNMSLLIPNRTFGTYLLAYRFQALSILMHM